jgi:hypothetical protein
LLVGIAHLVSGIAVLVTPEVLRVTPLASLARFADYIGYHSGGFAAAALIGAGLMAIIGANLRCAPRFAHGFLFLPQQVLLLLQVWTITAALIEGHFPDGYIPVGGAWFILTDQIWAWLLAVTHSIWLTAFLYGGRTSGNGRGT